MDPGSVLDGGGAVLYQQTHTGHTRLTDDHVRIASFLTSGMYPLLRARSITPPLVLGKDNVIKHGEYADAGIPHYWIID